MYLLVKIYDNHDDSPNLFVLELKEDLVKKVAGYCVAAKKASEQISELDGLVIFLEGTFLEVDPDEYDIDDHIDEENGRYHVIVEKLPEALQDKLEVLEFHDTDSTTIIVHYDGFVHFETMGPESGWTFQTEDVFWADVLEDMDLDV